MSRPAKGARLWLRPEKRSADGTLRERAVWVIRDGLRKISTGRPAQDREGAERALGDYLASKYQPNRGRKRHPTEILIADVLAIYLTDVAPQRARAKTGNPPRMVSEAAARRELEDLRAAINHHRREGYCSEIVS